MKYKDKMKGKWVFINRWDNNKIEKYPYEILEGIVDWLASALGVHEAYSQHINFYHF